MKQSEIPIRDDLILESEQLCNSKQKVFIPQAARSKSNAWHLILSSPSYPQTFIGEVCRSNVNNTSNCSKAIVLLNYYGKCVQKYIQRKMIALNEDMNKVIFILVDVPSCCSCNLIRI
nr:protein spaetzle 5-like [Danaus plexippus plexippus]